MMQTLIPFVPITWLSFLYQNKSHGQVLQQQNGEIYSSVLWREILQFPRAETLGVSVSLLLLWLKIFWQKKIKREEVYFRPQLKVQSILVDKSIQSKLFILLHLQWEAESNESVCLVQFPLPMYTVQDPSQGMMPPTVGGASHIN